MMRRLDTTTTSNVIRLDRSRLETPRSAGFRPGMSSCAIIGRKLGSLYDVPSDSQGEIESALRTLDRRLGDEG